VSSTVLFITKEEEKRKAKKLDQMINIYSTQTFARVNRHQMTCRHGFCCSHGRDNVVVLPCWQRTYTRRSQGAIMVPRFDTTFLEPQNLMFTSGSCYFCHPGTSIARPFGIEFKIEMYRKFVHATLVPS
jgi:hypothetical protein